MHLPKFTIVYRLSRADDWQVLPELDKTDWFRQRENSWRLQEHQRYWHRFYTAYDLDQCLEKIKKIRAEYANLSKYVSGVPQITAATIDMKSGEIESVLNIR